MSTAIITTTGGKRTTRATLIGIAALALGVGVAAATWVDDPALGSGTTTVTDSRTAGEQPVDADLPELRPGGAAHPTS